VKGSTDTVAWTDEGSAYAGANSELSRVESTTLLRSFWRVAVSDLNSDIDGLNDWEELEIGTMPTNPDTDNDSLFDGYEVANDLDPFNDDSALDTDGDGMLNAEEFTLGTAANRVDTDGDGLRDGYESAAGRDPATPDHPYAPPGVTGLNVHTPQGLFSL